MIIITQRRAPAGPHTGTSILLEKKKLFIISFCPLVPFPLHASVAASATASPSLLLFKSVLPFFLPLECSEARAYCTPQARVFFPLFYSRQNI
jgi:hypothetical protein